MRWLSLIWSRVVAEAFDGRGFAGMQSVGKSLRVTRWLRLPKELDDASGKAS